MDLLLLILSCPGVDGKAEFVYGTGHGMITTVNNCLLRLLISGEVVKEGLIVVTSSNSLGNPASCLIQR